jgi:hypothetical protein
LPLNKGVFGFQGTSLFEIFPSKIASSAVKSNKTLETCMERASQAAISPAATGLQANYTFPLTIVTALFFVAEGVEDEAQRISWFKAAVP